MKEVEGRGEGELSKSGSGEVPKGVSGTLFSSPFSRGVSKSLGNADVWGTRSQCEVSEEITGVVGYLFSQWKGDFIVPPRNMDGREGNSYSEKVNI